MPTDKLLVETQGTVRVLTLNRPDKRNALDLELFDALGEAVREAGNDDAVAAVVVRGAGKMFSSGIDLGLLAQMAQHTDQLREKRSRLIETCNVCEQIDKPVIAELHGACIGMGLEFALACDFRVAAEGTWFGLLESRLGLIPDVGGSSRLPAVVGLGWAKELIMTGRLIDTETAQRIGLVTRVASADGLTATTDGLIGELAASGPLAVANAKHLLDEIAKPQLEQNLAREIDLQERLVVTDDFREGVSATQEKRQANWLGR